MHRYLMKYTVLTPVTLPRTRARYPALATPRSLPALATPHLLQLFEQ